MIRATVLRMASDRGGRDHSETGGVLRSLHNRVEDSTVSGVAWGTGSGKGLSWTNYRSTSSCFGCSKEISILIKLAQIRL